MLFVVDIFSPSAATRAATGHMVGGRSDRIAGILYACMKTTVDLPEELMIEVKKAAAERRTTIRDLVERGLRRELAATSPRRRRRARIRWVTVDGGVPPGVDVIDRTAMHDWISGRWSDDRD
ncbi:hypothetical protein BH23CHL8_BH23CHL8_26070 [soil metagenome]